MVYNCLRVCVGAGEIAKAVYVTNGQSKRITKLRVGMGKLKSYRAAKYVHHFSSPMFGGIHGHAHHRKLADSGVHSNSGPLNGKK